MSNLFLSYILAKVILDTKAKHIRLKFTKVRGRNHFAHVNYLRYTWAL